MNVDTMTEREMDIAIAEWLGYKWWHRGDYHMLLRPDENWPDCDIFNLSQGKIGTPNPVNTLPCYSTDANATREMEAELQRRGLTEQYAVELMREVRITPCGSTMVLVGAYDAFRVATATPAERCRAALRVAMGRDT